MDSRTRTAPRHEFWSIVSVVGAISIGAGATAVVAGYFSDSLVIATVALTAIGMGLVALFVDWRLAFYALAATVPLSSVVVPNSSGTVFRWVGILAIVAFAIGVWRDADLCTFVFRDILDDRPTKLLIGFVMVAFASGLWAANGDRWVAQLFTWGSLVAVFIALSAVGEEGVKRIWSAMLAGSVAAGLWAMVAQAAAGPAVRNYGRLSLEDWDPNGFALVMAAVLVVSAIRRYSSRRSAIAVGIAQSVLLAVIFLTGSRTGAISLIGGASVAIGVSFMGSRWTNPLKRTGHSSLAWFAVSVSVAALMLVSIPRVSGWVGDLDSATSESQGRIVDLFSGATADVSGRGPMWLVASSVAADNVMFGVGAGNLEVETLERGMPRRSDPSRGVVAHNTALQIVSEVGVVGSLLYFGFWVVVVMLAIGMVRSGDRLALAMLAGLVVFGIGSLALSLQDEKTPIFLAGSIAALHMSRRQIE